ncbi:MAG: ABC transporter permease [Bryobacteraceae bacterium]|nr:ABC transporter permease [Bryobacteraceae bacterium]
MTDFLRELGLASRSLRKHSKLAAVAIISIALGMGVNAAVFSWIESVLISPLPGASRPAELLSVKTLAGSGERIDSSWPDLRDIGQTARSFTGLTAFRMQSLYVGEGTSQTRVWAETVTGNFFDVMGVRPIAGRTFNAEEQADRPGGAPVAVLGETFWRNHYKADPSTLGRTIQLNRQTFTIVGIVPAEFEGPIPGLRFDVYVPLTMSPVLNRSGNWLAQRGSRPLSAFARLAPGVTLEQANAELSTIGGQLDSAFPASNRTLRFRASTIADAPEGVQSVLKNLLQVLFVIGLAVMLLVCANVGNLLVARTIDRQREFAVRLSLGAGRWHLLRQLIAEAVLLTLAGGALGIFASLWFAGAINFLLPPVDLPLVRLDRGFSLLGGLFTGALALLVTLFCAIAPAWPLLRGHITGLAEGGRSNSASVRTRRLRNGLVMAEISLATVALIGCALFVQSFRNSQQANPGFRPDGILLAGLDLTQSGYTREQGRAALIRLQTQLNGTPGVRRAALAEDIPLGFSGGSWEPVEVSGYVPKPGDNMRIWRNVVSPGYFETMEIRLKDGRGFDARDRAEAPGVAVVNETFVRQFFDSQPAIGRKFRGWGRELTVVGVARDSRIRTLSESPLPYFYVPLDQFYRPGMGFGVITRTEGPPERFETALRSAIQSADPNLAVTSTARFVDFIGAAYLAQKLGASVLTAVSAMSVLLAMIGLYGAMLHAVSTRTHEIGIRIAVGAQPGQVLAMVLREGFVLSALGAGSGALLALAGGRFIASLLYGVQPFDAPAFGFAVIALLLCGVLSAWVPAWRAATVDPVVALRRE